MIRDVHPGYESQIRILIFYPSRIPDSGVKNWQKGTGSRIRNTARENDFKLNTEIKKRSYYLDMVLRCGLHGPREVGVDTPPVRVQVAATGEILDIEYEHLLCQNTQLTSPFNTYYRPVLIQPEQNWYGRSSWIGTDPDADQDPQTEPYLRLTDPDADPDPALFVGDLQDDNKK